MGRGECVKSQNLYRKVGTKTGISERDGEGEAQTKKNLYGGRGIHIFWKKLTQCVKSKSRSEQSSNYFSLYSDLVLLLPVYH